MEQAPLQAEPAAEAEVGDKLGALRSQEAAEGPPGGGGPALLPVEELTAHLAEESQHHCFHHSLGWADEWQMALDGRVPSRPWLKESRGWNLGQSR